MKLAVIGTGNMGQALVDGMVRQGRVEPTALVVYDVDTEKAKQTANRTPFIPRS